MNMLERMKYFAAPLPEDICRQEEAGHFQAALDMIQQRLSQHALPQVLRERLELEKVRIVQLEKEYPFSYHQALSLLQSEIQGLTEGELDELIWNHQVDWIFKEGQPFLIRNFLENLHKIQHPLMRRLIVPEDPGETQKKQALLNENMRYMKEHGKTAYYIRIRSELSIKDDGKTGTPITVHIPIPTAGPQVQRIQIHALSHPAVAAPENSLSRTVCFQKRLEAGDVFSVEYSYENHLAYVKPDPELASGQQPSFCLEEKAPHILFTPFIRALYQEIVGEEANPLRKAKLIYDYITSNVRYSYVRRYSTILNIPEYAGVNLKGDCGVQAALFITLCRYGGIPARWQSGLFATPYDIGGHDWAQFYVLPYGWLYADLSFGGSAYRLGNEERRQFYFGNLDPFRMPANLDFQREFTPAKRFMRCDPTDNQYGECEYEDRGLQPSEYECRHTVIEMKQIDLQHS